MVGTANSSGATRNRRGPHRKIFNLALITSRRLRVISNEIAVVMEFSLYVGVSTLYCLLSDSVTLWIFDVWLEYWYRVGMHYNHDDGAIRQFVENEPFLMVYVCDAGELSLRWMCVTAWRVSWLTDECVWRVSQVIRWYLGWVWKWAVTRMF